MQQQLHLIYPAEIVPSLHKALEKEGFSVCGVDFSIQQFTERLWDIKLTPHTIIVLEGTSGIGRKEELLGPLREIRRFLPKNRIVIQLRSDYEKDTAFVAQIVALGIYDLFFAAQFNIDDMQRWIRNEKTLEDYAHVTDYRHLKSARSKAGQGLLGKWFGRGGKRQGRDAETRVVQTTSRQEQQPLNPLELEPEVVFQDRIIGMVKIGVSGVTHRTGTTCEAIQLSLYLAGQGFKVACVEMRKENKSSAFVSFKTEAHSRIGRCFTYKKAIFYPQLTVEEYVRVTAAQYDYVVIDYGEITDDLTQSEFVRCDLQILTMGATLWDFQYFYEAWKLFSGWEYRKPWYVLVNFADEQMYKDIVWSFSRRDQSQLKLNFVKNHYHPNPLELPEDVFALEKMLGSVLPKQESKKRARL